MPGLIRSNASFKVRGKRDLAPLESIESGGGVMRPVPTMRGDIHGGSVSNMNGHVAATGVMTPQMTVGHVSAHASLPTMGDQDECGLFNKLQRVVGPESQLPHGGAERGGRVCHIAKNGIRLRNRVLRSRRGCVWCCCIRWRSIRDASVRRGVQGRIVHWRGIRLRPTGCTEEDESREKSGGISVGWDLEPFSQLGNQRTPSARRGMGSMPPLVPRPS